MRKVMVIIPAYNEEKSLRHVFENVRSCVPDATIVVIDDGSQDSTGAIAESLGGVALQLPCNVGIGAAEQTGFLYAIRHGYDTVVRNDGDGQHNPAEIPLLLETLDHSNADVVIGSRYLEDRGYITPPLRRFGIRLLSRVISLICGAHFTDPTSGFRAFNRRAIQLSTTYYPHDYPEPESVVLFRRAGLSVCEIPVTMNPRYGGQSSIRIADSVYYMFKVLLAIFIEMMRKIPNTPALT
ncbi:MAG: glycosyl transferase family 2 [Acidobacteria bacterium]|nr:MAG: glycosyl transferase family 2 [Acidobacteriota bacterium]